MPCSLVCLLGTFPTVSIELISIEKIELPEMQPSAFLSALAVPLDKRSNALTKIDFATRKTVRLALAKPPTSLPSRVHGRSDDDSVPYVGIPPPVKPGRLRFDPNARFYGEIKETPLETRQDTEWQRGNLVSRSIAIWTFVLRLLLTNWLNEQSWTYLLSGGFTGDRLSRRRRSLAQFACKRMLTLGPTMIKAGQLASTRADLLPKDVIEELSQLQDRVPASPWPEIRTTLEREFGKPVDEVFLYFEKVPIAAASLGQVHRAILFSGEYVVVKIQRPRLSKLFDMDLYALRIVAQYLAQSKQFGGNGRDWMLIYEECSRVLREEIDYERECRSCQRFGENFRNAGIDWVKVPLAYKEYTTKRVLCLQYLPGIKISDVTTLQKAGLDTKVVANRVANAFLRQVLDFAFFSSDPHPGNVAVGPNEVIIFYDFGMMGEVNPRIKERLVDILYGVVERDATIVMNGLAELDVLVLPEDPSPIRRAIQFFLNSVGSRPTYEQTVSAIGEDLYAATYDRPFRLPAESIFLMRAMTTLEALARGLDPDFRFAEIAFPYAKELLEDRTGGLTSLSSPKALVRKITTTVVEGRANELANTLTRHVIGAGTNAARAAGRIEKIERLLNKLENGDVKLRSRSTETEKLLRRQFILSESSNFLLSSGTMALAATQLYVTGSVPGATVLATLSAIFGIMFLHKYAQVNKQDRFDNS